MNGRTRIFMGGIEWLVGTVAILAVLLIFILFILVVCLPVWVGETILAPFFWVFNIAFGRKVLQYYWLTHQISNSEKVGFVARILS